jgi:hypothetical protein
MLLQTLRPRDPDERAEGSRPLELPQALGPRAQTMSPRLATCVVATFRQRLSGNRLGPP